MTDCLLEIVVGLGFKTGAIGLEANGTELVRVVCRGGDFVSGPVNLP